MLIKTLTDTTEVAMNDIEREKIFSTLADFSETIDDQVTITIDTEACEQLTTSLYDLLNKKNWIARP